MVKRSTLILLLSLVIPNDFTHFSFVSDGNLVIYSSAIKDYYTIDAPADIIDYEQIDSTLYVLTTWYIGDRSNIVSSIGYKIYRLPDFCPSNTIIDDSHLLQIQNPRGISKSPNGKLLIVKTGCTPKTSNTSAECKYFLLNADDNNINELPFLDDVNVLGWVSNSQVLTKDNSLTYLSSIDTGEVVEFKNLGNRARFEYVSFYRKGINSGYFINFDFDSPNLTIYSMEDGVISPPRLLTKDRPQFCISDEDRVLLFDYNCCTGHRSYSLIDLQDDSISIKLDNVFDYNLSAIVQICSNMINNKALFFISQENLSRFYLFDITNGSLLDIIELGSNQSEITQLRMNYVQ